MTFAKPIAYRAASAVLGLPMIALASWSYWEGWANYVVVASIVAGLISCIGLLVSLGPDPATGAGSMKLLRELSAYALCSVVFANVIGFPLREPGLRSRMRWGEAIAALLDRYERQFGRYPESLEALSSWGDPHVPPLWRGGMYEYQPSSEKGNYELGLHLGLIEAHVLNVRQHTWERYFCW